MPLSPADQAWSDQYDQQQAAQQAKEQQAAQPKQPPTLVDVGTQSHPQVTSGILDSVMGEIGKWGTAAQHVGQDVNAGLATAAGNTMDVIKSAGSPADPNDPANAPAPVWDHAREAIGDFRDAMVVQDPTGVDPLIQAGAQLAVPFAAYSKALGALHGISNIVAAGAATDLTALAPHDMRTADLIRLGQTTDTKIGAALRAIGPYGLNAYVNYLADRTNETEAQGRFKNALDGLGANLILTPLIHAAGIVVKQGTAAARYALQNGIRNTVSDLAAGATAKSPTTVYHGTGTDFDEFDASKIGTGEGNQSFGHGLYFAENPETAGHYRETLSRANVTPGSPMDKALNAMQVTGGDSPRAYQALMKLAGKETDVNKREGLTTAAGIVKAGNATPRGKLMHVEIAGEHIDNMLDYDKPLTEQPEILKRLAKSDVEALPKGATGQDLLEQLGGGQQASLRLQQLGVPGIRFLDQGSRGAGEGTRNIVLFNAKHAKIVKKE